jgi:hypothetical protein
MTEHVLNLAAIALELGIPLLMLCAWCRLPQFRRIFSSVLLAVSPLLILYLFIGVSWLRDPSKSNQFAFAAMWLMSFFPFAVLLAVGLIVGVARHRAAGGIRAASGLN